jgi:hypothetical protein
MNNPRYEGKPLLRLLECCVLKSLDMLPEADAENLKEMQPRLARLYGKQGSWDQIIAATMELPENLDSLIREMWSRNLEIAKANGSNLTAQQFAEMFVDQNLS